MMVTKQVLLLQAFQFVESQYLSPISQVRLTRAYSSRYTGKLLLLAIHSSTNCRFPTISLLIQMLRSCYIVSKITLSSTETYLKNKRITMRTPKSRNCFISTVLSLKDKDRLVCNIEYMSRFTNKMLLFSINYIATFDGFFANDENRKQKQENDKIVTQLVLKKVINYRRVTSVIQEFLRNEGQQILKNVFLKEN